jgi:uncharacterized protein involved in copper resistance
MLDIMIAMALAAAAQAAPATPAANPHAQHAQPGQMDHSTMDHSKMDHSKMADKEGGCCKKGADGKMECAMSTKTGAGSARQGHSNN